MAEETAMRGAASVTVARVIARAGVSRRLFYELFADIEDCFQATFEWSTEQARAVAAEAYEAEGTWRESIRSALAALLRFFDEQPLLAQLCIVHAAGGGSRVLELRSQTIAQLCEVVDRGRAEVSGGRVPGPVVAEGVVGAVIAVLYTRLLGESTADRERATGGRTAAGSATGESAAGGRATTGSATGESATGESATGGSATGESATGEGAGSVGEELQLIELHGELMSLIVLPYLGASTARKELDRPAPPARAAKKPLAQLPATRLEPEQRGARLTYRTVRVLRAIAELPAGSNREVAERAGIVDQGQISKILTRLEYQGLVVNRGGRGAARGTPNAWWLTERGEQLERELNEHPTGEHDDSERLPSRGSKPRLQ
jgi:AcrR family transcriptional regulator/DNA-binding MarR family transcriptional regulator